MIEIAMSRQKKQTNRLIFGKKKSAFQGMPANKRTEAAQKTCRPLVPYRFRNQRSKSFLIEQTV